MYHEYMTYYYDIVGFTGFQSLLIARRSRRSASAAHTWGSGCQGGRTNRPPRSCNFRIGSTTSSGSCDLKRVRSKVRISLESGRTFSATKLIVQIQSYLIRSDSSAGQRYGQLYKCSSHMGKCHVRDRSIGMHLVGIAERKLECLGFQTPEILSSRQ